MKNPNLRMGDDNLLDRRNQIRLINLTPHPVTIILHDKSPVQKSLDDGETLVAFSYQEKQRLTFKPEGQPLRLTQTTRKIGEMAVYNERIPLSISEFGRCENLPEPQNYVIYIVSLAVAQAYPDRRDLVFPNEIVRDINGNIIGCRSLARIRE